MGLLYLYLLLLIQYTAVY
jgi:hypothetical protein